MFFLKVHVTSLLVQYTIIALSSSTLRTSLGNPAYESLGCYKDSRNRALPNYYALKDNTVEGCFRKALELEYTIFAVQFGGECWLDDKGRNDYDKYGTSTQCKHGTGGYFANNVYKIKSEFIAMQRCKKVKASLGISCDDANLVALKNIGETRTGQAHYNVSEVNYIVKVKVNLENIELKKMNSTCELEIVYAKQITNYSLTTTTAKSLSFWFVNPLAIDTNEASLNARLQCGKQTLLLMTAPDAVIVYGIPIMPTCPNTNCSSLYIAWRNYVRNTNQTMCVEDLEALTLRFKPCSDPPSITQGPNSQQVSHGTIVNLVCRVRSLISFQRKWYKDGELIRNETKEMIQIHGTLETQGSYYCEISSLNFSVKSQKALITLSVVMCPALRIPQNGVSLACFSNHTQRFNTSCQIKCNPGYQLTGSSVRTCMENGEWSGLDTICTVKLEVQMELRILNVKYSEDFKNKSSDVYINFAKNFTDAMDELYKKTEGYQKTIILDIRNGSIKVDFKVVIVRVITKPGREEPEIKVEVAGIIIAKIKTKGYIKSLKVDADPKTLQLKMAPPAPKKPQMVEVKATSVVIQWDAPEFHQYYHIDDYIVGIKKFGSGHEWVNKAIAGTDIRKYILTNLKPETRYYVTVAATNQHGRGVATQPQAVTTETAGLADWAVALIVIVLLVLVAVVVLVLWYRKKYNAQQARRRRKLYLNMAMEQTESSPYDNNQKVEGESISPKFSEEVGYWHKISWENLQLSNVLGSGAFGEVYKGKVLLEGDRTVECAIKTVKANATEEEKRDLYKEFEIMSSIGSHPNLVNLIGACTKEDTLYIAIEFATNGCLHDYLKNNRLDEGGDRRTTTSQIKKHTRLMLALDVANGMAYLASKRCIHRDLAARNVLLTEEYRGKIADFGMSRDIYTEGVYEKKTAGKLPVRWMALEAIETFMFTAETDVWSYGVLLWEIESGGITPWSGLNAKEIVDTLKNGGRLEQPADCNQEIYEIMLKCWDANPKERPSFKDLADRFEKLLDGEQTDKIRVNCNYEEENV